MGCGASAAEPKAMTVEQMNTMCQDGCVRMQVICIKAAFAEPDTLAIAAPPQVQELRKSVTSLQAEADKAGKAAAAEPAEEKKGGLSGMMSAVAGAATQVATGIAGGGLGVAAQGLDAACDKLEEPWPKVAQDVVAKDQAKLYNICVTFINGYKFAEPAKIVRGSPPWNEYSKVPGDTISTTLGTLASAELVKQLYPAVQEALKEHAVTSGWKKAETMYNGTVDLATSVVSKEDLEKAGIKKITCDIETYVTQEIVKALVKRMAKEEVSVRTMGGGEKGEKDVTTPKKPISFAKLFSPVGLYESDYKFWENEGK